MKFEWDKNKSEANLKKHEISFEHAALVFSDKDTLSLYDEEHSGSEDRWITLGQLPNGNIIVVTHAYRNRGSEEFIRIISARKATKNETRQYFESKPGK